MARLKELAQSGIHFCVGLDLEPYGSGRRACSPADRLPRATLLPARRSRALAGGSC